MLTDVWFWAFCGVALVVVLAITYHLGLAAGYRHGHSFGFREGWRVCEEHSRPRAKLLSIGKKEQG